MAQQALSLQSAGLDALTMQDAPHSALSQALLDFAAAPGRHALRLREPPALFDGLDTIAVWALGRLPDGLAEPQALRQAALMFVLRACFAPGLNHYQLLGLSPSFSATQLRARYRALIRLTHPDMGIEGLPDGAAGMVNRAHAVLSDDAQRAAYDRRLLTQLPSGNGMPQASSKPMGHGSGHGAERASERVGATTRWLPGVRLRSRWADFQQVVHAHGLRLLL
jgi:hypothetical protein